MYFPTLQLTHSLARSLVSKFIVKSSQIWPHKYFIDAHTHTHTRQMMRCFVAGFFAIEIAPTIFTRTHSIVFRSHRSLSHPTVVVVSIAIIVIDVNIEMWKEKVKQAICVYFNVGERLWWTWKCCSCQYLSTLPRGNHCYYEHIK